MMNHHQHVQKYALAGWLERKIEATVESARPGLIPRPRYHI